MRRIKQMMMLAMLAALLCGCGATRPANDDRPEENISAPEEESSSEESAPEAVEESLLSSAFASAKPGNELQFGTYEQDNNLSNGAEPIEWVVLANEGDKIFVLSKYVLDPSGIKVDGEDKTVTWETSEEREWLNSTFYEEVFSEEEKRCILKSDISTPDTEGTGQGQSNHPFHTYGGADTSDFLFFLSYEEVREYAQPLGIATAKTTGSSSVNVNEKTGYSEWLLRSPGEPRFPFLVENTVKITDYAETFAAIDSEDGDEYVQMLWDEKTGERIPLFEHARLWGHGQVGIRPAMWLKVQ